MEESDLSEVKFHYVCLAYYSMRHTIHRSKMSPTSCELVYKRIWKQSKVSSYKLLGKLYSTKFINKISFAFHGKITKARDVKTILNLFV